MRTLFRLLSLLCLSIATIMLVLDATRSVAASGLVLTPLSASWGGAFPTSFEAARSFVTTRLGTASWDAALGSVLALPGWAVFAALALAIHAAVRRPEPRRRAVT